MSDSDEENDNWFELAFVYDEAHMNEESEYLLKKVQYSKNEIDNLNLKEKHEFLVNKINNILLDESDKQKEKEHRILNEFNIHDTHVDIKHNENIIVNIELDQNKINAEKERLNKLKDKDLFYEVLKLKSNSVANIRDLIRLIKFNKEYENILYPEYQEEELDIKQFIERIMNDESYYKNFKKYCRIFVDKCAGLTSIIENTPNYENKVLTKEDIEKDLEICDKLKEIDNKDVEDILKVFYPDNKVNVEELINALLKNDHIKKFKNINKYLLNILDEINKNINSDNGDINYNYDLGKIFDEISKNEELKKEFKNFLLLIKKDKKEDIPYLIKGKEYINKNVLNKNLIENKIPIPNICSDMDIYYILALDDKFAVQTEKYLSFYDIKNKELIQKMKYKSNNAIILKKGNILAKYEKNNYCLLLEPKSLKSSKLYFTYSCGNFLTCETYDEKIIMNNQYGRIAVYSKINNIYTLIKYFERKFSYLYLYNENILFLAYDDILYQYSYKLYDFQLMKFKINKKAKCLKCKIINESQMLIYYLKYKKNSYRTAGSYIDLIDIKTLCTISCFITNDDIFDLSILSNGKIIVPDTKDHGLFEYKMINNNLFVKFKLYKDDEELNKSLISNINEINKETILFYSGFPFDEKDKNNVTIAKCLN